MINAFVVDDAVFIILVENKVKLQMKFPYISLNEPMHKSCISLTIFNEAKLFIGIINHDQNLASQPKKSWDTNI